MQNYYLTVTINSRKSDFAHYLFDEQQNVETVQQKVDCLYNRLSQNPFIGVLNNTYGISFDTHEVLFKACLNVLVEFLG